MSFEHTSNYNDFLKYIKLKNSLKFEYKKIDLSKAFAWEIINYSFNNNANFTIFKLSILFKRLDAKRIYKIFNENSIILSTLFAHRKDYSELMSKISESIDGSIVFQINPHKMLFSFNFRHAIQIYNHIFKNEILKNAPFRVKFHFWKVFMYGCNQIDELEKKFENLEIDNKCYIPFNSSINVEALLTLYFNTKNVITYHTFHGIFGRYKDIIVSDIINGENITARRIFAFSQVQKEDMIRDFNKINENVFVSGHPKYPFKKINVRTSFNKGLVLNGFSFYDENFKTLLDLLKRLIEMTGISFDVKLHPTSNLSIKELRVEYPDINFLPGNLLLSELINNSKYDFAIAYNTVTYYECMYYDLLCLRYTYKENVGFLGLEDKFIDENSFTSIMEFYRKRDLDEINEEISSLLIQVLGMGINNYNSVIQGRNDC